MSNYSIDSLFNNQEIKTIFNIFETEEVEVRLVGGCVRNIFLQLNTKDIDFAAKAEPKKVIDILRKNNIKFQDFAKNYGSITAFINNHKFEITSLRKDIDPQGRHTEIMFTEDWNIDAARRDFTMNSIYITSSQKIIDYFGGVKDLENKKIKFIGEIEKRINEDYLRIFRYFRFLGIFSKPQFSNQYEKILNKNFQKCLKNLSNEIIRIEILKMLKNPYPMNSFVNKNNQKKKKLWLIMTEKHFLDQKYNIGLDKCLNKVNELF